MAIKEYKKGSAEKVAANFSPKEFDCHGSTCGCKTTKLDDKLVEYLQKIRDHFGKPVTISSGYRCPVHNKSIGGATASYHMKGQAADTIVAGVSPAEVAKYAESIGVLGIGLYETNRDGHFVHIDTRTSKAFWYGQSQARRTTFGGAVAKSEPVVESKQEPTTNDYTLEQFIKDVQVACGAPVTGKADIRTLAKTVTVSASRNRKHAVVKPIQKRLLALGYKNVGEADGVAGSMFKEAVIDYQKANNFKVKDGEITAGKTTWKKLLGMI